VGTILLQCITLYLLGKLGKLKGWLEKDCSNKIERKVYRHLREHGIHSIPQFKVKSEKSWYKLDFGIGRIDLEIDGPFHETEVGRQRDKKRDAYLRKHGWHIIRVPYRDLQKNFEGTMKSVIKQLRKQKAV
jgi:very-short-patch-repair endonuclease